MNAGPLSAVGHETWRFAPQAWCDCGWRPGLRSAADEARRHAAETGHRPVVEKVTRTTYILAVEKTTARSLRRTS